MLSKTTTCRHVYAGTQIPIRPISNIKMSNNFCTMVRRCYDPHSADYRWYGAKGIHICKEWLDDPELYIQWFMSECKGNMKLTIDRINPNKGYSPENCRLIEREENARWKSSTLPLDIDGVKLTGRQWAEAIGHGVNFVNTYRRKYGEADTIEYIKGFLKLNKEPSAA